MNIRESENTDKPQYNASQGTVPISQEVPPTGKDQLETSRMIRSYVDSLLGFVCLNTKDLKKIPRSVKTNDFMINELVLYRTHLVYSILYVIQQLSVMTRVNHHLQNEGRGVVACEMAHAQRDDIDQIVGIPAHQLIQGPVMITPESKFFLNSASKFLTQSYTA